MLDSAAIQCMPENREKGQCHDRGSSRERPDRQSTPTQVFVELRNVRKTFDSGSSLSSFELLGLDLRLSRGSCTLIRGASGSGKTTLLGLIGCLVRPTAGRIRVAGTETTRLPESQLAELRRHHFGVVFQNPHLLRGASAIDNVMIPALPRSDVDGDLPSRAASLLWRLRLADRERVPIERLSGGEQQRVAIARALINEPSVLLADEPTAHLDEGHTQSFVRLLETWVAGGGTVVVATHDVTLCAAEVFSRRLVLESGELREEAEP